MEGGMKKTLILGAILSVFFVFTNAQSQSEMPAADPQALWEYITEVSPYQEWGFWEDHKDMQPGNAPHGPFHKVFVNETLLKATGVPAPYGSIQVKESYDKNKEKVAITIMYKVKDYNPEAGDWYWARYSLEGEAGPEGKVQGCIGCHAVKADNDYILVHSLK
jgi:hypothetical protein